MIWSLGSSTQLHKLIILQKRFIRIISNANYLSHTDHLFHSLNEHVYSPKIGRKKNLKKEDRQICTEIKALKHNTKTTM